LSRDGLGNPLISDHVFWQRGSELERCSKFPLPLAFASLSQPELTPKIYLACHFSSSFTFFEFYPGESSATHYGIESE